ncbi:unnamed protein product [Callosobruchus maculatus]|nr:unnamed protein product [Callosobruchus maculatus]
MMLIILSHIYMYSMIQPLINPIDYAQKEENTRELIKSLGSLAVDTFFVTGGFLVSYNYFLKNTDERRISFCKFYLHRFLRLTPSLAVVVLFHATIFSYIGSGPFWAFINYFFIDNCKENWWSTLLYVQNFVHPNNMCIGQSWYLAVDTQLFVLAPFLLYFVGKKPNCTFALLTLLILVSCGSTFGISWLEEVGPAVIGNTNKVMKYIYVATYTRATPWLMGFVLGFTMARSKANTNKLKQGMTYILWVLPLPLMIGVIIYNDLRFTGKEATSVLEYSLYNSLCRLMWSLGICIIIFLCDKGYGGAVNRFLSHSVFSVLIKLNYSTYLLHILVIMYLNGQVRASHYAASYLNVFQFCSTYTITTAISFVWTLAFESPILILEKSLIKGS